MRRLARTLRPSVAAPLPPSETLYNPPVKPFPCMVTVHPSNYYHWFVLQYQRCVMSQRAMKPRWHPLRDCPGPDQCLVQRSWQYNSSFVWSGIVVVALRFLKVNAGLMLPLMVLQTKASRGADAMITFPLQQVPLCLLIMTQVDTQFSLIAGNRM